MANTTPSNCIYKSVTLAVGETFTLPPGATIVSASGGLDSFDTTCTKPTSLETPDCYVFSIAANEGKNSRTTPFANENTYFTGITIDNVVYPFTGTITGVDAGQIGAAMINTSIGSIFSGFAFYDNSDDVGWFMYVVFKTLPSFANNMFLNGYTLAGNASGNDGAGVVEFEFPAHSRNFLYANAQVYNNRDIPVCTS